MRQTDRLVLRELARCQAIDQYGVYLLPCPQSLACTTIIKLNPQREPRSALISDPAPMLCCERRNQLHKHLLVCTSFLHSFNNTLCVQVSYIQQVLTTGLIFIFYVFFTKYYSSNESGFIFNFYSKSILK